MRTEDIALGLTEGVDQGLRNFQTSMAAVQNARMVKEKNAIEAKKAQLDIKKMELELDPDVIAQHKELLNQQIKAQKTMDDLNVMKITNEARKIRQNAVVAKHKLDFFSQVMADPTLRSNVTIDSAGKASYKPQPMGPAIPPTVYAQLSQDAHTNAKSIAKKRSLFGAGEPTPDEINGELQKLIGIYRGRASATPPGGGSNFDAATEAMIAENMAHYNKSRDEVLGALRSKGVLK